MLTVTDKAAAVLKAAKTVQGAPPESSVRMCKELRQVIPANPPWPLASQSAMIPPQMTKNSNKMGFEFLWKTPWWSGLTAARSMSVKVMRGPNSSFVSHRGEDLLLLARKP